VLTRSKKTYINEMKMFCSAFTKPPGDTLFSCGAGKGGGCVDAYGYFQLCMMLRHPTTVYDLKNGSLKYAMTKFFPEVREMKAANSLYLARCARCFLKGLCEQCPAKSWMENGTLDTPVAYLCEIAHVQARYLGLLEQSESAWEITDWEKRIREFSDKPCLAESF
jgi:radical SAM protein with 4Fe4S-binding SPASM domain